MPEKTEIQKECCAHPNGCASYCATNACTRLTSKYGTCCDGLCFSCGDCGGGALDCCDTIEIQSFFSELSHGPERINLNVAVSEIKSAWPTLSEDKINAVLFSFGAVDEIFWKVSVMARAYAIDCLDDIANGADVELAHQRHFPIWVDFAVEMRQKY